MIDVPCRLLYGRSMNIFVLSRDPEEAARSQCDRHVVKMLLESVQLLCTLHEGRAPYRPTHHNHPCTRWLREGRENYRWTMLHAAALSAEYTLRYGRTHRSHAVLYWCVEHEADLRFPDDGGTEFVQAMPPYFRDDDPVVAYRRYYQHKEQVIDMRWRAPGRRPSWL